VSNHLKYFKVENFKCLDSFEMNDIGQFNLIAGNNDVGKTSLLESLLFNEDLKLLKGGLFASFISRNDLRDNATKEYDLLSTFLSKKTKQPTINYEVLFTNSLQKINYTLKPTEIEKLSAEEKQKYAANYLPNQNRKYVAVLNRENILVDVRSVFDGGVGEVIGYLPYIQNNLSYADDLVDFYTQNIQTSKEVKEKFIGDLKLFMSDIEDVEISSAFIPNKTSILLRLKDIDSLVPLSMFGDCSIKLFRFLSEFKMVKDRYIMIDEIDTGIHFGRFKEFWKTILKSAKENNVQIFATTHSLECLKYFKEALEDDDMKEFQKDARHFLIKKTGSGQVKSFTYNFEQFEHAIEAGNEIRK
jgi:AAA15 family ATPase/GTPase